MKRRALAKLGGTVEIDETYWAGKARRCVHGALRRSLRHSQRNGDLRLINAKDAKSKTVREISRRPGWPRGSHYEPMNLKSIHTAERLQKESTVLHHTREYAHGDVPCRLIASVKRVLQLKGRHTLFGHAQQVSSSKPLRERQVGIMDIVPEVTENW